MSEAPGYRDNLALLNERYPCHDMLTIQECGVVLGLKHRQSIVKKLTGSGIRITGARVSKTALARYMCGR